MPNNPDTANTLFDGVTIDPQFGAALKLFIANITYSGRAQGSGNATIPGSYAATKVAVALQFSSGINFDATNHRFICTTAGNYMVAACAAYVNTATGEEIDVAIYKNGSIYSYGFGYTPGGVQTGSVLTDIVQLNPGDYIELWTLHSDGSSRNLAGAECFLSIAKQ